MRNCKNVLRFSIEIYPKMFRLFLLLPQITMKDKVRLPRYLTISNGIIDLADKTINNRATTQLKVITKSVYTKSGCFSTLCIRKKWFSLGCQNQNVINANKQMTVLSQQSKLQNNFMGISQILRFQLNFLSNCGTIWS